MCAISKTEERQVIYLSSEGAEAVIGVVIAVGGVRVAALVHGDHHAAVRRQPLHPLLHWAVAAGATEVAPACIPARVSNQQRLITSRHVFKAIP
jgi:hypothetical protein